MCAWIHLSHNISSNSQLPILKTVSTLFSSNRITEETLVLVQDIEALSTMSQIVSSTDSEYEFFYFYKLLNLYEFTKYLKINFRLLNNFIVWSLTRTYLPFMSRDFRNALESFEQTIYHFHKAEPAWHFCSKLVQKWMPFGIEALQQNPELIVVSGLETSNLFF